MRRIQDTNVGPGDTFISRDPGTNTPGTKIRRAHKNDVQEEICRAIESTGEAVDTTLYSVGDGNRDQLAQMIAHYGSGGAVNYIESAGSAVNVYKVEMPDFGIRQRQQPKAYYQGMEVIVILADTNTAASTINVGGLGDINITDTASDEIIGGKKSKFIFNDISGEFEISKIKITTEIKSITATVAANNLTLGLKKDVLDFRNQVLTSGISNTREFENLSLIVPSGATLGTINTIQSRLILLAIDNAGTIEPAVINLSGGVNLDETTLITTVAIDATADLANVIYSDAARANVPFRVVGFIESTQAIAGTWATNPSTLQGAGGNALTAMSSIGYGQTQQDLSGSRSVNTTYYNTTGKPISVTVGMHSTLSGSAFINVTQNGVTETLWGAQTATGGIAGVTAIIPHGASYLVKMQAGTVTVDDWIELR